MELEGYSLNKCDPSKRKQQQRENMIEQFLFENVSAINQYVNYKDNISIIGIKICELFH